MQYLQVGDSTAQVVLNSADQRNLLYSQYSGFGEDGVYARQSYGVVPIPAAFWLFGSGLIGLIGVARRKV